MSYPARCGAIKNLLYDINIRDLYISARFEAGDLRFVGHSGIKSTTTGGS